MMLCSPSFAGQINPHKARAELPPTNKIAHVHITQGPALELANSNSAIRRDSGFVQIFISLVFRPVSNIFRCEPNRKKSKFERNRRVTTV
jgi:hypothetical protein